VSNVSIGGPPNGAEEEWSTGPGLLEAVWQYRWLVAGVTLAALLTGFAASFLQTTMYQGEARLLLADPRNVGVFRDTGRVTIDPSRYVRNQAQFVTSTPVAVRTSELLDGRLTVRQIDLRVTAQPSVDLDLITIRALDPTAEGAAELANAVAQAYQDQVAQEVARNAEAAIAELEQSTTELEARIRTAETGLRANSTNATLQAERDAAVSQLITIQGRADQIAVDAALYGSGVELFERAEVPERPAQPQPLRNAAVAAVLGLLAASAFSWWRAEHTQAADRRQDAAPVLGAPLLGEIPDFAAVGITDAVPAYSSPKSVAAEAYQFIVASLEYALERGGGSSVLLTSASPGDGKTTTALNLAVAAAKDGRKVLLVDGDERVRGLTRFSGVTPEPGLTDLGDESLPFDGCVAAWKIGPDFSLPFVPGGSEVADTAGYFRTPAFRTAMHRIKAQSDFVLVDSPPLLAVSDTSAVASQVDGIVIVVSKGTPLKLLEDVRQRLSFIGTPLLGYVFNRSAPRSGGYGYAYYGNQYTYGYTEPAAEASSAGDGGGKRFGRKAAHGA
jgi:Mrp family chromosome partitioning ATPase/capsular polysaccharide biosynthesis protein